MSPVLLHALLQDAIASWNHNCGVRNRLATDFKTNDHSILEDINKLAASVGAPEPYDLVQAGWGIVRKVGRCRLTVSKPDLKARQSSALEIKM